MFPCWCTQVYQDPDEMTNYSPLKEMGIHQEGHSHYVTLVHPYLGLFTQAKCLIFSAGCCTFLKRSIPVP